MKTLSGTIGLFLIAGVAAGLGYRAGLVAERSPSTPSGPSVHSAPSERPPSLPNHVFDDDWRAALVEVMGRYERIQTALAADQLAPLAADGEEIRERLRAETRDGLPSPIRAAVAGLERAAADLSAASTLDAARVAFAELGRLMVAIAVSDPRLQEGWAIFRCPMVEGFPKWFQRPGPMANPYMGQRMLACGSKSSWDDPPVEDTSTSAVAHYTCPMHPSIRSPSAGACPICGMDLVPVTERELESGDVRIDESRRQKIGVKLGRVERRRLRRTISAAGRLTYDETKLSDVSLRQRGWVVKLHASATGQTVRRGDVLFTVYSPELLGAMKEYQAISARGEVGERQSTLLRSIEERLKAWDVGDADLARLREGTLRADAIPVRAKADGVIVEKNLVEGAAFEAGTRLFRIAGLDTLWLEAEIYEGDLAHLAVGQEAEVEVTHVAGQVLKGRVSYVYPYLDPMSRTARARIELPNTGRLLRPEMYATVRLEADLGERLALPISAVIYTGPRRLVFLDRGEGRFQPVEVQLGVRAGQYREVLAGVSEGDPVVVSGNFLIASESRLRSAAEYWSASETPEERHDVH